jgi:hypothetical protein
MVKIDTKTIEQELEVYKLVDEIGAEPTEVEIVADGDPLVLRLPEDERYAVYQDGTVAATAATDEEILELATIRAVQRTKRLQRELLNLVFETLRNGGDVITAVRSWYTVEPTGSARRLHKLGVLSELDLAG